MSFEAQLFMQHLSLISSSIIKNSNFLTFLGSSNISENNDANVVD